MYFALTKEVQSCCCSRVP